MPPALTPSDPYRLVGRTVAGRYAVGAVHRRTRLAVVYRAQHVELRSGVALKVLHLPAWAAEPHRERFLARFAQEARTVAALNHPAMARVLDYGELALDVGATPWMAIEWLDGRTLADDLAARPGGRRSPREALALLGPALDAIACAHEAGVAHRDVKPANLLLVPARRGESSLRVIDFGIAKVMEPEESADQEHTATRAAIAAFSPLYAAPEQVAGSRTGPWTDVHALGLILTELLTGASAYRADDERALFAEVLDAARPTPGRAGVDVGPWEAVLARALHARGAERHADAGALRAALERSVDAAQAAWEAPLARNALADTRVAVGELHPAPSRDDAPRAARRAWVAAAVAGALAACAALLWASRRAPEPAAPDGPVPVTPVPAPAPVAEAPPTFAAPARPPSTPRRAAPARPRAAARPIVIE
ncbi:MAG: serine/threonine-protein kinase [Polyangiales bacterium]